MGRIAFPIPSGVGYRVDELLRRFGLVEGHRQGALSQVHRLIVRVWRHISCDAAGGLPAVGCRPSVNVDAMPVAMTSSDIGSLYVGVYTDGDVRVHNGSSAPRNVWTSVCLPL